MILSSLATTLYLFCPLNFNLFNDDNNNIHIIHVHQLKYIINNKNRLAVGQRVRRRNEVWSDSVVLCFVFWGNAHNYQ